MLILLALASSALAFVVSISLLLKTPAEPVRIDAPPTPLDAVP